MKRRFSQISLKSALLVGSALMVPQIAWAQDSAPQPGTSGQDVVEGAEIIVTGYRESLNAAVAAKRDATSQVDVILAEDIAKFPDQNLAESLQRIPGISIQRDAGEGRAITVRGLGAQFTRVRVNGMETIATSTDGASANRDRAFDFNVFASELFNSIVVHKTAEASLDEGSLGAVVDLNTGNPLAYDPGFTFVASAQARYNDLGNDIAPRLAGLIGWTNADQTFGVSASVAWSKYTTLELGNNTVRWQQASFGSVNGTPCYAGGAYVSSADCDAAALAFHPRIPRYGEVSHDRERLGATASIQWAPSDRTHISIDGLYSDFKEDRDEHWAEVLFRSNEKSISLTSYTLDSAGNMVAGTVDNAWVRTERYHRESETEFYQISGKIDQEFSDSFRATLRGGFSRSDADIPVETTLIFDDRDATDYSFDYSDMYKPVLSFGAGIDDPTAFQLAEFRDRPSSLTNKFQTFGLDLAYDVVEGFTFKAGGIYRKYTFDTVGYRRDSTYCAAFACAPGQYGMPVTGSIANIFNLGDAGQPSGTTTSWVEPDLDAAADAVGLYARTPGLQQGEQRYVSEKVTGGYGQVDFETWLLGMRITGNAGVRYVHTEQLSSGFNSGSYVTVERSYDDVLPSFNLNLHLRDDLILRGAIAKVITRPSLGSLTPGGSVDQFNYSISSGNPYLDPYRATTFDAALEWYFAPGAIVSVALFAKQIESFPISSTFTGTYASSGLPTSLLTVGTPAYNAVVDTTSGSYNPNIPFTFKTSVNGPGADLKGVEFAFQLPFSVFSESLGDFGVLGNVTLVDSNVDYTMSLPGTSVNPSGSISSGGTAIYSRPLLDLAKTAANGTIYYDNGRLSIRASVAYRGEYADGTSGNFNIFEGYGDTTNVDASIRYKLTEQIELSIDGTNLLDTYRKRWVNEPSKRNYEYNHFGRVFMAGVRVQI
ncbi:TonB-dependent receptor [Sphingosinithalassobacter portus]|uniref:TonB-dependent receptor n=1 Tax=Stakelama portus TaxID=2676234 RepID=UPI000D6E69A8|nr:TonB-dependent receptor [Sphingosinithalassobacter portus]